MEVAVGVTLLGLGFGGGRFMNDNFEETLKLKKQFLLNFLSQVSWCQNISKMKKRLFDLCQSKSQQT